MPTHNTPADGPSEDLPNPFADEGDPSVADSGREDETGTERVGSIAVYVCTHRRNDPLKRMLASLHDAAQVVQPDVEIAVVVVDDNPDGRARSVVETCSGKFTRGIHYRHSGAQNISRARNLGLESAMELADWVAMTDDDQVVTEGWFAALVEVQARTGADAVTGPVLLRYPSGCPRWLEDQPINDFLVADPHPDGARVETCSTGNSMLRSSFLLENPSIRFRPDLGVLGGEDMVFYRAATVAGLDARYATDAVCWAEQPPERTTYRYILGTSYWLGNTEYLTNIESGGASRLRLGVRGGRRIAGALARPLRRRRAGEPAQWRYAGAVAAQGMGLVVGMFGVKVAHR